MIAKHKKQIVIQRKVTDENTDLNYLIFKIYEDFIDEIINLNNFNDNEYKKSENNQIQQR